MKIVGIITEYNPFHNGHQYHIEQAKKQTGASHVIAVMSGNFVQRGAPSVMPKHLRAEAALKGGADVVLELPLCYATGSAEYFALGAVSLLEKLGCTEALCFGSECGKTEILSQIALLLADEPEAFQRLLSEYLKSGLSFPAAREKAVRSLLGENFSKALTEPNNILGIEYLKALRLLRSHIRPYTVRRKESGYHDTSLAEHYSSATALRRLLSKETFSPLIKGQIPPASLLLMEAAYGKRYPVYSDDFSLLLKQRLLSETPDSLASYADVTPELANRIAKRRDDFLSFGQFCLLLKTKELTYTRISRALLHILLGVKKETLSYYCKNGFHAYARILGFRTDASDVLSLLKKNSSVPLVTKLSSASLSEMGTQMLRQELSASDLYESVITDKFETAFRNEHRQPVVRI